MYAEVQKGDRWEIAEPLKENRWAGDGLAWIPAELGGFAHARLFAILCNYGRYRNGPFTTIALPRGFPNDASSEVKTHFEWYGPAAESPSWLLAQELYDFDWQRLTGTRTERVAKQFAHLFQPDESGQPRVGFPDAAWINGGRVRYAGLMRDGVEVQWVEPHEEAVGKGYLDELFAKLRSYGTADQVRVVFWFSC